MSGAQQADEYDNKEIKKGLKPQADVFREAVAKQRAHAAHAYEATDGKGAGEETADALPKRRDAALGPAYSAHKEQCYGREDDDEHDAFPIPDHFADEHGEEYAGKEVGDEE